MKLLGRYLYQRRRDAAVFLAFCLIFAFCFGLYRLPLAAVLYPALLCLALGAVLLALDFGRARRAYLELEALAGRAAAPDSLPAPDTLQESGWRQVAEGLLAQLAALESDTAARTRDTVEYYTVWVHQIKTPIAAMRLALQDEDTPLCRRLRGELFRIEQYVEVVLAFLRLGSASTDYLFRECALDDMIRQSVRKFAPEFIARRLRLDYLPASGTVVTDEKWFCFVLEQLLSNALKYTPAGSVCIGQDGPDTLFIQDTGIGIAPEDLPRIFEQGYTGQNGRLDKRASGLGLFLCKRVCGNLGLSLRIDSAPGQGTRAVLGLTPQKTLLE